MDMFWANADVLALPTSERVEVIVHDGACDFELWPGPGRDRDLLGAYGPGLREALHAQHMRMHEDLPIGGIARFTPGRLHCDFLLWVATRKSDEGATRSPGPTLEGIEAAVTACLEYCAERDVASIGFGPMGEGGTSLDTHERLAAVARAVRKYEERCFASGRATGVELVRICEPRSAVVAQARKLVGAMVRAAPLTPATVQASKVQDRPRRVVNGSGSAAKPARGKGRARGLDPDEVQSMRPRAGSYDRTRTYAVGEWVNHARFGIGQVREVIPASRAIQVLFEDGQERKMLHGGG